MAMAETNSGDDAEVMRLRSLVKDLEQQNTVLRSQKLSKPVNSFSGGGESIKPSRSYSLVGEIGRASCRERV